MLSRILLCGALVFAFSWATLGEKENGDEEDEIVGLDEVAAPVAEEKKAEKAEEAKEEMTEVVEEAKEETKAEEESKEEAAVAEEKVEEAKEEVKEEKENKQTEEVVKAPAEKAEEAKAEEPAKEEKAEEGSGSPELNVAAIGKALLLWLPNRLVDLSDIISADVGAGSEFAVEVGITKFFSLGGANGEKYFLMKGYERQFGGGYDSGWNYQTAFLNSEKRFIEDTFGSVKKYYKPRKPYGLIDYTNFLYQEHVRDIWALEIRAGWLAVLGIQMHPTELADFITGIFFIDLKNDDWE